MPELIANPSIRCAGYTFQLLPQRALWWASKKTLLVADVHLGKGATFRALGQPFPRGGSAGDLQRLAALVAQLQAKRLIVLGDFWHSRRGLNSTLFNALHHWRVQHVQLQVMLVRGNHDRAISKSSLPVSLGIEIVEEPFPLAPGLYACHEPPLQVPGLPPPGNSGTFANMLSAPVAANGPEAFYLAGHLHPAVRLRGRSLDSARLPCFVWQARQLVLPAFGSLAGHLMLDLELLRRNGARAGIVAPDTVWLV